MTDGWTHVQQVMGMAVSYDIRGCAPHDPDAQRAIAEVEEWLRWVDATFSTYIDTSEVNRIERGELAVADASPELGEVLEWSARLAAASRGYFDVHATGRFDPSGVVKGWSVEEASRRLAEAGWPEHSINAAGDIRVRGGRLWRIGIAHPMIAGALVTVVGVVDAAIATSGLSERGAHVFDPHTGRAALDLASVTVIGPELTTADGYATAALAMGLDAPAWLAELDGYEAYVVDAEGGVWATEGFAAYEVEPGGGPH